MRKFSFIEGEHYHVYNRGTDKRTIFLDNQDWARFLQSMVEFNVTDPIGSLYQNSFHSKRQSQLRSETPKLERVGGEEGKLVEIIAYCLNPNHFHLILKQVSDKGIAKFMQKVGTGYTNYFNHKYQRTGALFQGVFKAIHIDSNEYLLHLSAYVNLNFRVHQLKSETSQYRSSWEEYVGVGVVGKEICEKEIILGQFQQRKDYQLFAQQSLDGIRERKKLSSEMMLE